MYPKEKKGGKRYNKHRILTRLVNKEWFGLWCLTPLSITEILLKVALNTINLTLNKVL
jgi:hypothetical protein